MRNMTGNSKKDTQILLEAVIAALEADDVRQYGFVREERVRAYGMVKSILYGDLLDIMNWLLVGHKTGLLPDASLIGTAKIDDAYLLPIISDLCERMGIMTRRTNEGWAVILESSALPEQTSGRIEYLKEQLDNEKDK